MELIIANVVDAYRDNVALIQDPALREHETLDSYYIEDRALLWGGPRKLVVTSQPVAPAHLRYLQQTLGYEELVNLSPHEASDALCEDVLREPGLQREIAARLRGQGPVSLISFVASQKVLDVADALRGEGLEVETPECPPADLLWVRDYLDSKAGFRRFFTPIQDQLHGVRIPEGAVCESPAEAARIAGRFLAEGRGCICKPNNSQSGVGFHILRPGADVGAVHEPPREGDAAGALHEGGAAPEPPLQARLEADSQMTCGCIVVEELIDMDPTIGGGSPSIEMCVPADPARDVEFMYPCGQILTPSGYFFGVEMYRDVVSPALERTMEEAGLAAAREMRRLGYVGIFDMDMVAAKGGELYAVEVNTRRTGGTHAHEAAQAIYGPRYWERAAVISNNDLAFEGPRLDYDALHELLAGLIFPIAGRKEGILPTIISSLVTNRVGYIAFAADIERARELEREFHLRLAASGRPLAVRQEGVTPRG